MHDGSGICRVHFRLLWELLVVYGDIVYGGIKWIYSGSLLGD